MKVLTVTGYASYFYYYIFYPLILQNSIIINPFVLIFTSIRLQFIYFLNNNFIMKNLLNSLIEDAKLIWENDPIVLVLIIIQILLTLYGIVVYLMS